MAYIPDGITERRRKDGVSHTALEIFLIYCEHADQDTGLAFPSPGAISERLGVRLDHVKTYERELLDKGWTSEVNHGNRQCKKLLAGWISRAERARKGGRAVPETADQRLGNDSPSVGESPQSLVNSSQSLGTHIRNEPAQLTSPINQPTPTPRGGAQPSHALGGVGVLSKLSFERIHEWAKHRARQPGSRIEDPHAVAQARWRDGTADADVLKFERDGGQNVSDSKPKRGFDAVLDGAALNGLQGGSDNSASEAHAAGAIGGT